MNGMARVSVETGVVFLPVDTPYDQDVLFEYLHSTACTHRQVQVELDRLRLLVTENGERRHSCAGCDRMMVHGAMRYVIGRRIVCVRCARALVRDAEHAPGAGHLYGRRADDGNGECTRDAAQSDDHVRL